MKATWRIGVFLGLVLAIGGGSLGFAAEEEGVLNALRELVERTESLQAEFEQTVEGSKSSQVLKSSGRLVLQRPGRFRWDYEIPYPQQIVADGERIWIYDTELEQVTVRPLEEALGSAPSLLLSGGIELDKSFDYRALPAQGETEWVELVPKEPDSNFEKIRLGFIKGVLRSMELEDSFGQITRFRFSSVELNPPVNTRMFRFVPPAGVDVIGQ
ncbi:MAG: outer membrane lipoprotein chaperone LolA [Gammaproteobacteria bacterium]